MIVSRHHSVVVSNLSQKPDGTTYESHNGNNSYFVFMPYCQFEHILWSFPVLIQLCTSQKVYLVVFRVYSAKTWRSYLKMVLRDAIFFNFFYNGVARQVAGSL